nr:hypothetical protein [Candidatus Sigynarchaeota archaeon]
MSFKDLKETITSSLKPRLEMLNVPDPEGIVQMMEEQISRDQSLLLMLSI